VTNGSSATAAGSRGRSGSRSGGTTLIEVAAATSIVACLAAIAVPALSAGRDTLTTAGAARHVAALVERTRSQAVQSVEYTAIQFAGAAASPAIVTIADGNRNGVRTGDITRGIDMPLGPVTRLEDQFPGARFGLVSGVTDVDDGTPLSGSGIRLSGGALLSFSPNGTCTTGTLYVRGRGRDQYAIRVLGATGRVRLLRFSPDTRSWGVP
jgi:type II secretory pathway pseudopilin PulG